MKKFKNYLLLTILLILALTLIICCGGGGGGGGGAAAGPAASEASAENEPESPSAPEPVRSAAAEILSFKFEQAKNDPALSALSSDLEGRTSDNQIIVDYNYGTLDAHPQLKPTIKISSSATIKEDTFTQTEENGETIWTTNDAIDFFTNAVTFTVKAENGTERVWTVILNEMAPGEYRIIYRPENITSNPYPATYNESTGIQFNENSNKVTAKNYYFDGWYEEETLTTPVTGWGRMEKTGDVTLYAKLQPAPYADLEHSKIFANGIPVTVKNNAGATMVYFTGVDGNEKALSAVNENYTNFEGFDLYAGTSGDADAPTISTPGYTTYMSANAGNITIEGGRLNNVYGGNGNTPKTALTGGSNIYLSGNPEIGNQKKSGIWLKSFSGNKVNVDALVNATNDNKITLIAAPDMSAGAVVVDATSLYTLKEHYTLRNSYRTENVELESCGNSIKIKAGISLPDPEDVTWSRDADGDYFTLGPDHFHSDGTILSIGVEGGFFKVSSTTVTGGNFDMAIRYSDDNLNVYVDKYIDGNSNTDNNIKTSDKLKYVQFKSAGGDIEASAASSFLENIHFYIEPGKSQVKIKLNLQTVSLTEIASAGVTYFNGSFYKIVSAKKSWSASLAAAKESKFNNLSGYLMTITSQTENMFIYDRVFKKQGINQSNARGWIGAKKVGEKWQWACGPEKDTEFYDQSTKEPLATAFGMYSAWDNFKDRIRNGTWTNHLKDNPLPGLYENGNPKYTNSTDEVKKYSEAAAYADDAAFWPAEKPKNWYINWPEPQTEGKYAYYSGIYAWMTANNDDASDKNDSKKPRYYIIEYTAYDGEGGRNPTAPVLIAEKDYSR